MINVENISKNLDRFFDLAIIKQTFDKIILF